MRLYLLGICLSLLGCFAPGEVQAKMVLNYCSEGPPGGFDPAIHVSSTAFDASSRQIFERLVEFKTGTTLVIPGLARSWLISKDGTEYTFHLRKGVKFHATEQFKPSRDFNADDVVFSFKRQLDPGHAFNSTPQKPFEYFNSMGLRTLIKDVVKVNANTVQFILHAPEAPFLADLAMDFASIHSAEYAAQLSRQGKSERLNTAPIGTGPFQLIPGERRDEIRFAAHPFYWRGRAKLDEIVFKITPDAAERFARLQRGVCHIAAYPNFADLPALKASAELTVTEHTGLNTSYLAFNTQKPPFDNPAVRRALGLGIDRDLLIAEVFKGAASPAKSPIPPQMWGHNTDMVDDPYAPEAAKYLLKKAGVKNLEFDLWTLKRHSPYNNDPLRMARLIKENWAKIGVHVNIVALDWNDYLERSRDGEHDAILLGWSSDNGDPDNFMHTLLGCEAVGGANRARWCYLPFEHLVQEAKRTGKRIYRARLYQAAQFIFKDQAPWMPLAHAKVYDALRSDVRGYKSDPFGRHIFYDVEVPPTKEISVKPEMKNHTKKKASGEVRKVKKIVPAPIPKKRKNWSSGPRRKSQFPR